MRSPGLRRLLLLLVLLATAPAFLISLHAAFGARQDGRRYALASAESMAGDIADRHARLLETARDNLTVLAQLDGFRRNDVQAIHDVLRKLDLRSYTAVSMATPDGTLFANHPGPVPVFNVADRQWFRDVLEKQEFTLSGYVIGRQSGRPVIIAAVPVPGWNGETASVLWAGLDLHWLDSTLGGAPLPPGATVDIVDNDGIVLARHPERGAIGQPLPDEELRRLVVAGPAGHVDATGADRTRIYCYQAIGEDIPGGLRIVIGIPHAVVYRDADRRLAATICLAAVVSVASFLLAWLGGNRLFVRPVLQLTAVAQSLGQGMLSARCAKDALLGREVRQLAESFNSMAESLEAREREATAARGALQENEARLRTLLAHFPNGAVMMFDRELRYTVAAGLGLETVGLAGGAIEGRTVREVYPPDLVAIMEPHYRAVFHGLEAVFEVEHGERFFENKVVPVRGGGQEIVAGMVVVQDVTSRVLLATELEKASRIDGLTGLGNRRHFDEVLDREWRGAIRRRTHLAALMIDVDLFKAYNDNYGHQAGDDCLRKVAACVATVLKRPSDFAARYGGEEFVALLPGTDLAGGVKVAEKIRACLDKAGLEHTWAPAGKVTVSIGVAAMVPAPDQDHADLITTADNALYAAKCLGRNRTATEDDPACRLAERMARA